MLIEYIEHYNWKILTAALLNFITKCWLFVHIQVLLTLLFKPAQPIVNIAV